MTRDDLEAHYRRYIDALNERRLDQLDAFVEEALSYNGRPMTRRDYRDLIAGDVAAIPDLFFAIDLLLVDGDHVGCRLAFDCTPVATFLGLTPNGKRIAFTENVFYRFRDGRIAEVWSLIDRAAVEAQFRPAPQ